MIVAVFDTNVLASGFAGYTLEQSTPGELIRRWNQNAFSLVITDEILLELENDAFSKPYFRRQVSAQSEILAALRHRATIADKIIEVTDVAPDRDDNHIIAAAVNSQATYIVTGDKPLLLVGSYSGIDIVSPVEFLAILDAQR